MNSDPIASSRPSMSGPPIVVGRYAIYGEIAAGGMATVHLGRLQGEAGFQRTVAIKRLHPQFSKDPDFVNMFLDEARIAARIRHPNVVSTLDVVNSDGELLLVMDYVHGESLSKLVRIASAEGGFVPLSVASGIVSQALLGLHAAHEAKTERGEPLGIVHRDVSPQNIMVGADGVALVLDFGVAKAAMRASTTRDGQIKGKIAYMAPEQFGGGEMDRRVDVFAAGVVLWEALTSRRLFAGQDVAETLGRIASGKVEAPSKFRPEITPELDAVVLQALASDREQRFPTALAFAEAIEGAVRVASSREIGAWVDTNAAIGLGERSARLSEVESSSHIVAKPVAVAAPVSARTSMPIVESTDLSTARTLVVAPGRPSALRKVLGFAAAGLGGAVLVLLIVVLLRPSGNEAPESTKAQPTVTPAPESPPAAAEAAAEAAPRATETAAPADSAGAGSDTAAATEVASPESAAKEPAKAEAAAEEPAKPAAKQPAAAARPRATTHVAPPVKAAKPKVNCNPPYSIDAQGIKRVKPECL
ncbi:MAG: serine/threonine protein kinase [Polyangiaceae bacterium]|nr:serine/threonine protein kinase [Polyangiaceae bacterium]MCB9609975.1 serine/threonine protein kinase [Polyangiaceae bacterium]